MAELRKLMLDVTTPDLVPPDKVWLTYMQKANHMDDDNVEIMAACPVLSAW